MDLPIRSSALPSRRREPWPVPDDDPLDALLGSLRPRPRGAEPDPRGGVSCHVVEPARPARHAAWPAGIPPAVLRALARKGIERPFTHQAEAIGHALAGRDVVVVTPTASGKTLCYAVPVLSTCLRDPDARSLWVFPTKALALDQLHGMRELAATVAEEERSAGAAGALDVAAFTFDGDTPADVRRAVRQRGRVVITNPDMLHSGILPHHAKWASLFEGLRYVVIDELHSYRGVLGSHVANVLRRLLRVAEFHGSRPTFVLCSATIANPQQHAEALLGRPVELVAGDGAPRGERHVVFYNPPIVDLALGIRAGAMSTVRKIASRAVASGLQTIVFATSRLAVEILTRYLKDSLRRMRKDPSLLEGYRGGYLPNERRRVQDGLRDGTLRGVVATNALELGLDVGSLDVAILCGYPGSISSTLQQMGRVGRRGSTSGCVLVARGTALDQYVMAHPEYFFGATPEHARISADNLLILVEHVKCAAFELPFRAGETYGRLPPESTHDLLTILSEEGLVHREHGTWHWTSETHPAEAVSLRSVSSDNFVVVDTSVPGHRVIAEVDFPSAPTTLHEKAIYMVGSRQHQVDRLDYEGRKAYVTPVDCDYYTEAETYRTVAVLAAFEKLGEDGEGGARAALVRHGEVRVSRKVIGFKKIKLYTMENLGYGDVTLPEHDMHTTSYWFTLTEDAVAELVDSGLTRPQVVTALGAAATALHAVATVLLACDGRDLGSAIGDARGAGSSGPGAGRRPPGSADGTDDVSLRTVAAHGRDAACSQGAAFEPTLYLFDNVPGGTGFSPLLYDQHAALVRGAVELAARCRCDSGCPGCVGPTEEAVGAKEPALRVLRLLLRDAEHVEG